MTSVCVGGSNRKQGDWVHVHAVTTCQGKYSDLTEWRQWLRKMCWKCTLTKMSEGMIWLRSNFGKKVGQRWVYKWFDLSRMGNRGHKGWHHEWSKCYQAAEGHQTQRVLHRCISFTSTWQSSVGVTVWFCMRLDGCILQVSGMSQWHNVWSGFITWRHRPMTSGAVTCLTMIVSSALPLMIDVCAHGCARGDK